MTTTLENAVLEALRPGSQLTLASLARSVRRPRWLVRRAANALRRKGLIWQYWSGEWRVSPAGTKAVL